MKADVFVVMKPACNRFSFLLKGNNVIVKTAEEVAGSNSKASKEDYDSEIEKHHKELNEESVVSLTDLLEAANQDEVIARYHLIFEILFCICP